MGTSDQRIVRGLLSQIVNAMMYVRYCDQDALNFVVAFIKYGKPPERNRSFALSPGGRHKRARDGEFT